MKTGVLFFALYLLSCGLIQAQTKRLYVSFDVSLDLRNAEKRLAILADSDPHFTEVYDRQPFTLKQAVRIPEARLAEIEQHVLKTRGDATSVRRLRNLFEIEISAATDDNLQQLSQELKALKIVRYTSLMAAKPVQPPTDIPPATPDYLDFQNYIGSDPGVNMGYAWDLGYYGQNIAVRDVEYGVNVDHEEFNEQNVFIQPGMTVHEDVTEDFSEHGTAAIGVLYNHNGTYGSTGMVFDAAEVILFPEYTAENDYNRVNAVSQAFANSYPGDVIMYEMQAWGITDYAPAEYDEPVWDLTRAAVDYGIVIVAAAGNGDQDLDSPPYEPYMNRGNSGAIIVGAGTPNTSHNRVSFSTFGSRVDVQGWGYDVFSTGYGDAYELGGDFNQRYTWFSGTSSATPVVTSCVVNLQAYYYDLTGNYLLGEEIRDILQLTGIPQGTNISGNIGPLPNMEDAMLYIDDLVLTQQVKEESAGSFVAYPNPVKDQLRIRMAQNSGKSAYSISNSQGKIVLEGPLAENELINLDGLESGVYFVTLSNQFGKTTRRVIKN